MTILALAQMHNERDVGQHVFMKEAVHAFGMETNLFMIDNAVKRSIRSSNPTGTSLEIHT